MVCSVYLHEDGNQLLLVSEVVARWAGQPVSYVVKDYYVTLMLRETLAANDQLVFKGGTALSKCYGVIKRFSEDIDLGIEESYATQGQRRKIKAAIVEAAQKLGLEIANLDQTRSRREFNRYELPLPDSYADSVLAPRLYVETAVMTPISPTKRRQVSSLIGDYLVEAGRVDLLERYALKPFEVRATSLERALCDKVFAVCDYYLEGKDLDKPSRHIYDLHKLLLSVSLDDALAVLMDGVRLERRASSLNCPSAEEGVDVAAVLGEIIDGEAYRRGYERTTSRLLNPDEDVPYGIAITSVRKIASFLERG